MSMRTKSIMWAYCDMCSFEKVMKSENEMPPHICPACGDGKWRAIWSNRGLKSEGRGIEEQQGR